MDANKYDHVQEIVLVRHGRTERNAALAVGRYLATTKELHDVGIVPDHLIELDDAGHKQAAALGTVMKERRDDIGLGTYNVFFDSGYRRSVQTMEAILETNELLQEVKERRTSHLDLRERDPGYTYHMAITQVNTYFPWLQEHEAILGPFYARSPGGESLADVCTRVHVFLNSLRRARRGERVFVVTHGRTMLAFRYWLERFPPPSKKRPLTEEEKRKLFDGETLFDQTVANCEMLRYVRVMDTALHGHFEHDERIEGEIWHRFTEICKANGTIFGERKTRRPSWLKTYAEEKRRSTK